MLLYCLFITLSILQAGCGNASKNERGNELLPAQDIKQVMEAHVDELMAIPGVVGVAIGALDDGKPCIRVLVVEDNSEIRSKIPAELEGYPVVIDETGELRALPDEGS
jgi:hypothetical protein